MNRDETLKILGYIKVAYPYAYNKLEDADIDALTTLWQRQFHEFDYQVVLSAVDAFISSDTKGFMPSCGQIKEIIFKLSNPEIMTELEAWTVVKKALRNCGYFAQEEYDKLPALIQKIIDPATLHDWALTSSEQVDTVIASNFMRSYRKAVDNEKEMKLLPAQIRLVIQEISGQKRLKGGVSNDRN